MAKLTKHAQVLDQLHTMVKKQAAEAQKNISGTPGGDVKSVSVSSEHENANKNSVGPENVPQGYHQKPSEDSSEPLTGAKTAQQLGTEILDIIRKQGEAQDSVTGKPGDVKSESVGDDQEKVDKNAVKPENNKQDVKQKPSSDESEPVADAKTAEAQDLINKLGSYKLGREFCAALLKSAGDQYAIQEIEMMKEAGRRDFENTILHAAESLDIRKKQAELLNKQAQEYGAAQFDNLLKQAQQQQLIEENQKLAEKVAQYEEYIKQAQEEYNQYASVQAMQEQQEKLASAVADVVLDRLKSEPATTA